MNREKGVLFGFLYCLAVALGSFLIIKGTKLIPSIVLIGGAILILYLYAIPEFYKKYYILADAEQHCNFTRFIPIYNQVMLFTPLIAKLYLGTILAVIFSWAMVFIKPTAITFLPSNILMGWANGWIVIGLLLIVVNSIVQGLGYLELVKEIERDIKDVSGITKDHAMDSIFIFIQYLLLFIPVFRAISIVLQIGSLNKLVVFSGVTNSKLDKLMQGKLQEDKYKYDDDDDDYDDDDEYEDEYEDYDEYEGAYNRESEEKDYDDYYESNRINPNRNNRRSKNYHDRY